MQLIVFLNPKCLLLSDLLSTQTPNCDTCASFQHFSGKDKHNVFLTCSILITKYTIYYPLFPKTHIISLTGPESHRINLKLIYSQLSSFLGCKFVLNDEQNSDLYADYADIEILDSATIFVIIIWDVLMSNIII